MPGWHEATKELQADGTIQMVGIVQEQHPDRARLFMQWKEMGWPILVDSYDLLEATAVPITLTIDEAGIIRERLRAPERSDGLSEAFLQSGATAAPSPAPSASAPDLDALHRRAIGAPSPQAWGAYADALAVWGGLERIDDAIGAYREAVLRDPENGMMHFRLGVAYRMRYDLTEGAEGDFQDAVDQWSTALDLDPNQYIWRRRIQQYGPRLDKPYPFYDWVPTARAEIVARGDVPAPLVVEPRGSEFASPQRAFSPADEAVEPDPMGRVLRDEDQFIDVEVTAVPPTIAPGEVTRVHLVFRTIEETLAHWNNEAEEMVVWLNPPEGWQVDSRSFTHPIPPEPATKEVRSIEVEVRAPEDARGTSMSIPAYALYYVCEDITGICMYRRQDLQIEIGIRR